MTISSILEPLSKICGQKRQSLESGINLVKRNQDELEKTGFITTLDHDGTANDVVGKKGGLSVLFAIMFIVGEMAGSGILALPR